MGEAEEKCEVIARDQVGVITRPQAENAGMTTSVVTRRASSGKWLPTAFPGVFIVPKFRVAWLSDLNALVHATNGAACGPTGGAVWKLDGFDEYTGKMQVITAANCRYSGDAFKITRAEWLNEATDVTIRNNVRVLQPALLLASLGEWATFEEVEGAMDHMLRMKRCTWDELDSMADVTACRFKKGARMLREVISARSPQRQHTDSLLETKAVQILRSVALPKPVLQYEIFDGSRRVAAADLAYPEHRLLIETVGVKAHRSELAQYSRDCRRQNRVSMVERHFKVLQYTWEQLTKTPHELVHDVMRAIGIARQTGMELRDRPGGAPILLPAES